MGMFKNLRDLQKQASEMERNRPPVGETMRLAQERLANANAMLAAQTQAANMAAATAAGLADGTSVRQTAVPGDDPADGEPDADRPAATGRAAAGRRRPVQPGVDLARLHEHRVIQRRRAGVLLLR